MVKKRYKIFRYLLFLFIVLFISGAAVASVLLNREENAKESWEMNISLDNRISSSGQGYEVFSYRLTLISPARQQTVVNLSKDITATTREVSVKGAWTVVVEALNADGVTVGRGVSVAVVGGGRTVSILVPVEDMDIVHGSLSVAIDGDGSYVLRVYSHDMSELIDEARIMPYSKAEINLESGTYTFMILSSYNNSNVLASEKIRIDDGDRLSFSYSVTGDRTLILVDASVPYGNFALSLSDPVVHIGDSVTVKAEDDGGEYSYEWYIDGRRSDSTSSSAVLSGIERTGEKKILCLMREKTTGLLSTASRSIKVHEEGYVTKVGFVVISDESDQGYTMNFLECMDNAVSRLADDGYNVEVVTKKGVREDDSARDANGELASDGCEIIFNNSYGFEPYMLSVASSYPDTLFVSITNCESQSDGMDNTYNAFAAIYEGRYVSGVAAGMKLNEMIEKGEIRKDEAVVGYVGTYSLGEVVSGMTAYYLGVRSVCPSSRMIVFFVDTWGDMTLEEAATDSLIDNGAVIISQHSDTITPALTAQKKGVYHTGYNTDMTGVAPLSSLISCRIDWTRYFYMFIRNYLDGVDNPSDWTGTMKEGDVVLTPLNESIAAEGTQEKIDETVEKIISGELQVFDTSTFTVDGGELEHTYALDTDGDYVPDSGEAVWDGVFHESYAEYQSSPYFREKIDGITWLNDPGK